MLAADAAESSDALECDVAGPEVVSFGDYVRRVAIALGVRPRLVAAPRALVLGAVRALSIGLRDVLLTSDELEGLRQDKLVSREPPRGRSSVFAWIEAHAHELGRSYTNDARL